MITYQKANLVSNIFRLEGSIIPGTLLICIWPTILCFVVMLCKEGQFGEYYQAWFPPHEGKPTTPFAVKIYSVVLGFIVVFRTNMAIARYWEGITNIDKMFSKWLDGYGMITSFIVESSNGATLEVAFKLNTLKEQVAHWYTLMSALAILRLRGGLTGDITSSIPLYERTEEICTLIKQAVGGRRCEVNERGDLLFFIAEKFIDDPNAANPKKDGSTLQSKLTKKLSGASFGADFDMVKYVGTQGLDVLGPMGKAERECLDGAQDKVMVVSGWITTALVLASNMKWLKTPAPILSRAFQEMSAGILGFNQAAKVIMVPFPFPFTQLITVNLIIFIVLCPLMIANYTEHIFAAPITTLFVTMGYWGLNDICNEFENPYGEDPNDLPLIMFHKDFVSQIDDLRRPGGLPKNYLREWETWK